MEFVIEEDGEKTIYNLICVQRTWSRRTCLYLLNDFLYGLICFRGITNFGLEHVARHFLWSDFAVDSEL